MRHTWAAAALAAAVSTAAAASPVADRGLSLCGVEDGAAGDLNPGKGVVFAVCDHGTGTFTGSVRAIRSPEALTLLIDGAMTGEGAVSVSEPFGKDRKGESSEGALLLGVWRGAAKTAAGRVSLTALATSFSANSAVAVSDTQGGAVMGSDLRSGRVSGAGVLTGTLSWSAGDGVIDLGASDVHIRLIRPAAGAWPVRMPGRFYTGIMPRTPPPAVPEPSTWALLILGFGLVGERLRRRPRCGLAKDQSAQRRDI